MQINPEKLLTVTNFAKQKGLTRQHIYRLIDAGSINSISIDNILFVVLDEKSENFQRIRKEKRKK
jgi:DNA-binding phage protein